MFIVLLSVLVLCKRPYYATADEPYLRSGLSFGNEIVALAELLWQEQSIDILPCRFGNRRYAKYEITERNHACKILIYACSANAADIL